ncbi:MAG TPA: glycosyltransferase 87 family protein [Actinomycetota bacterium]|nr:glycosyltransferase 87 family protein [Actinomycetota bacterium]
MCALALAAGFALKAQCTQPWVDGLQYRRLCYNDVQALWANRGVAQRTFPYVHGDLAAGELVDGAIEYPVLTGLFMWASGTGTGSPDEYLVRNAVLLAPFGALVAYVLARMRRWRALMWAAAPAVVLYAFHNWDLLVVAAAVVGLYHWSRGRHSWAAVAFGLGAAFKMYPALFLAPLALERWTAGDRDGARRALALGAGTFALVNVPFALANFDGWWATYEFHRARGADWNSIWVWLSGARVGPITLPVLDAGALNVLGTVLTAASLAGALAVGWYRRAREGRFPSFQVCAAMLAAFLLWNKVHSPQYALWLLPFFVLVRVRVAWWVAYSIADLVVYVAIFRWFYDYTALGLDATFAKRALIAGVWARAVLLAATFVAFLRADAERVPAERARSGTLAGAPSPSAT